MVSLVARHLRVVPGNKAICHVRLAITTCGYPREMLIMNIQYLTMEFCSHEGSTHQTGYTCTLAVIPTYNAYIHVLMRDEKAERKKQARSNKQTQGSHFS